MVDRTACLERGSDLVLAVAEDGTVLYQSPSVERVAGYEPDALVGEDLSEYVHPGDRERLEAVVHDPGGTSSGDDDPLRYRFRHASGAWIPLETSGCSGRAPETGETVLVSRDVGALVAVERQRDRFEAILESLDDGVYAIQADGRIVYVNDAYAAMKGVDRAALLGTDIYDWASEDAHETIRAASEALASGERDVGVVEFDFSTVDGGTIPVEMRFTTVSHLDDELERTGVLRDVGERLARERSLQRKNDRLAEFASVLSHDLRNPLNVAQARVRMAIEQGSLDQLDSAEEALDRIEAMVADLLALAREGRSIEAVEPVDLAAVATSAWRTTETREATLSIDAVAGTTVLADPTRLQNVFENLVRNAIEHGGPGVTVTVGRSRGGFFLEDDGPGVPDEDRERVFGTGYTTRSDGTGFGLAIVRQVAEAHGWGVRVTEARSGGARFEFTGVEPADG